MPAPKKHKNEAERLNSLKMLGILDTRPEERFDRITRLVRKVFDVPIAVVSLVDEHRQWFKSISGIDAVETPRDISFCGHAILESSLLVVPDARLDERFKDNPLVVSDPCIRFYAGYPLELPNGLPMGTLCIIDTKPKFLTKDEIRAFKDFGHITERELLDIHLSTNPNQKIMTNPSI